jgi:DNA-binding transcriptional LysR family regulator
MRLEARLRAFTAFVRRRSFSGAAQELRVSQPAISRHIAALERDVRAVLVDRRSGGLTAAGDLLANHALRAEAILAQTTNLIGALREPEKGWLSIRAAGISGTYLVPDVVAEFQHRHPQVRVSFLLGTSAEVVETVRTHQAEIGVAVAALAVLLRRPKSKPSHCWRTRLSSSDRRALRTVVFRATIWKRSLGFRGKRARRRESLPTAPSRNWELFRHDVWHCRHGSPSSLRYAVVRASRPSAGL